MANHGKKVDVDELLPLLGETVKVLKAKKEGDGLVQSCDSAITIMSSFLSSSRDLHASIEGYFGLSFSYVLLILLGNSRSFLFRFSRHLSANLVKQKDLQIPEVLVKF